MLQHEVVYKNGALTIGKSMSDKEADVQSQIDALRRQLDSIRAKRGRGIRE
jgi:hypothetical protein